MKLIDQSWEWMQRPSLNCLKNIERAGRVCYKSEIDALKDSAGSFVKRVIRLGHESVIEHESASVKFVTNRGVTHELVRHRLASYSQESTRYVNYGGKDMEFIKPVWMQNVVPVAHASHDIFIESCRRAEEQYNDLLACGWNPEQAREVLPNAVKTEIIVTANMREWRHIMFLRCSNKAHPQIRELMRDLFEKGFMIEVPALFEDIYQKLTGRV